MKLSYLSKIIAASTIACYLALLPSGIPALAQNSNDSTINTTESEEKNFEQARQKLKTAAKEAREGIEAAGQAARNKIDEATKEAEKRLDDKASWGWFGLFGLIGLFGLAGKKSKGRQEKVHRREQVKQATHN